MGGSACRIAGARWLAVAILAMALGRLVYAEPAPPWTLPDEEIVTYAVKWGRLTVVDAVFALESRDLDAASHVISVDATTTAIPSRIYRVTNRYETVVDVRTGLPTSYRKECDEAKFQESVLVEYAQADRHAAYTVADAPARRSALVGDTHNLFSGLYYLRRHNFAATPKTDFHLDAKGVYWHARATRTRNLRTRAGEVWEVRVDFKRVAGLEEPLQSDLLTDNIVRGDSPLTLHIRPASEDEGRPPMVVYMDYQVRGFRLTAELRDDERDGHPPDG